jgi:Restriction endonuclease
MRTRKELRLVMGTKLSRPYIPASRGHRGRPYQRLVADVARAFDPGATVSEGEWVRGPDGRLDMDVSVRGTIEGREALVVIECKDFDPRSTGPVGRGYVDALDSKRHDLNADFTIICSNSGFTEDAPRKAKRKGIGIISVLRTSDHPVKAVIEEQMYLRRVKFPGWSFSYHGIDGTIKTFGLHQLRFMGCSVDTWLQQRAALIASANPTIVDRLRAIFNFRYPLTFQVGSPDVVLSAITVVFSYDTQWLTQTVQLDASLGLYDSSGVACALLLGNINTW